MDFVLSDTIDGVCVIELKRHGDARGWLSELHRSDESDHPVAMCYVSLTLPGVARGPHEHLHQSDYFVFIGPGAFRVYLWDSRRKSPTYLHRMRFEAGEHTPCAVLVPPGVVHAYKCTSLAGGMVINLPDRLYKGKGRSEEVDEVRHEDVTQGSPFILD